MFVKLLTWLFRVWRFQCEDQVQYYS